MSRIISYIFVFFFALPVFVSASALAVTRDEPSNNCNTGPVQCCNSLQSASTPSISNLLGLLGLVLGPVTGLVGLTCNPISVLGVGGNSCSSQPVCCTNNTFGGLIALGCNPINLNL